MKAGWWALGALLVGWAAALFVAPEALRPFCAFICHQRPERSFHLGSVQMPVCARCTGLYVGAALAVPMAMVARSGLASDRARRAVLFAALPTAITWTLEFAGIAAFSNIARFIAAVPLGLAAAWLALGVLRD
jgi:uncharacterized membrane protein